MGWFVLFRAVLVRVLFTTHGLMMVLLLHIATRNPVYWCISGALAGLFVETVITLKYRRGQEYKWCCPSVICYLLCVVPSIWFLEFRLLELRIRDSIAHFRSGPVTNGTLPFIKDPPCSQAHAAYYSALLLDNSVNNTAAGSDAEDQVELIIADFQIGLPKVGYEIERGVKMMQQVVLLLLILGRWMLPKGKLTHDQLSQLLLVYIGTASDIVEFLEAFSEVQVRCNQTLITIILAIWSWSLLQFTMVLTATKARKDKTGLLQNRYDYLGQQDANRRRFIPLSLSCCTPDVYGIVISMCMQDAPFLVLRLLLIFRYDVVSYTNTFFTCKNTLVCAMLLYRLIVVQLERRHPSLFDKSRKDWAALKESYSGTRLMDKSSSGLGGGPGEYYNYRTKVHLVERLNDEEKSVPVDYVVKRHFSASDEQLAVDSEALVDYVIKKQYGGGFGGPYGGGGSGAVSLEGIVYHGSQNHVMDEFGSEGVGVAGSRNMFACNDEDESEEEEEIEMERNTDKIDIERNGIKQAGVSMTSAV